MKNFSGVCQAAGADKPLRALFIWITNIVTLFISVIALKLGELYTCCPKTNRYCVLKGERLAISCASRPFLRGRFDYS